MSEDQIKRLELAIEKLNATLGERCANHQMGIKKNAADIDAAFDKIRSVEKTAGDKINAVEKLFHGQNLILARWSVGASAASAVLTAAAIKFFVG